MMINLRCIHSTEDSFACAVQHSGESTQLFWSFTAKQNLCLVEKRGGNGWGGEQWVGRKKPQDLIQSIKHILFVHNYIF